MWIWMQRMDSNHRPRGYEPRALPLRHVAIGISCRYPREGIGWIRVDVRAQLVRRDLPLESGTDRDHVVGIEEGVFIPLHDGLTSDASMGSKCCFIAPVIPLQEGGDFHAHGQS